MVRTEGLRKVFSDSKRGDVVAVENATFEAQEGQILGLLGKNGAGKSTLLRMLSTVLTPTSGRAWVNGIDTQVDPSKVRQNLGFMSASTALYGRMSPRDLLRYFGELYGLKGDGLTRRMDELIQKLEMGSYADGLCDKLSTGQKQRVNIARTLLHDPQVLFFDEPTSGLDVVMSQDVMSFVEDEKKRGKTIIYCTHIMSEVERLCDRVVCIHDGKLMGQGTVEEVKAETGQKTLEQAFLSIVGYQREVPA
ncbi:MAG: ATP-binding cassette domain-containing protein [Armatimonadetes bacterium]|nr:ATP-binding cassette domain-containing protein [Armatimonadota bacterium]MBS1704040.1 ATP-binding cassette domain-containing protein [Armatimonadota bacterium]